MMAVNRIHKQLALDLSHFSGFRIWLYHRDLAPAVVPGYYLQGLIRRCNKFGWHSIHCFGNSNVSKVEAQDAFDKAMEILAASEKTI